MKLIKRNGIYYLYKTRSDIRSLRTRDRSLAQDLLKEAQARERATRMDRLHKVKHISLRTFREEYMTTRASLMLAGEISKHTHRADDLALRKLEEALDNIPIRQIWSKIEKFKSKMLIGASDLEKRKNTVNTYIRSLSSAFAWAAVEDSTSGRPAYLDSNPFAETRTRRIKFKSIKRLPKYIPLEEISMMRKQLMSSIIRLETQLLTSTGLERFNVERSLRSRRDLGYMMEFYLYTGLRVAELTKLNWEDVSMSEGVLYVREAKDDEERLVPIAPDLAEILREMGIKDIGPVFHYGSGHVSRMFKSLARETGLDESRNLKGLRHSFGTYAAECGMDLDVIQATMGHSSVRTTEIYKTVLKDRQKKQSGKLNFKDIREA